MCCSSALQAGVYAELRCLRHREELSSVTVDIQVRLTGEAADANHAPKEWANWRRRLRGRAVR